MASWKIFGDTVNENCYSSSLEAVYLYIHVNGWILDALYQIISLFLFLKKKDSVLRQKSESLETDMLRQEV